VECSNKPVGVTHDFTKFRTMDGRNRLLTEWQGAFLSVHGVKMDPWIQVKPSIRAKGRIVCARSPRYNNPAFPWNRIASTHRNRISFIGLDEEYDSFKTVTGIPVDRIPTKNLLEVAEAIAGSDLFIGNQSSPCWVAMGLGHTLIQEVSPLYPDSQVKRPNAKFVSDGILR
jgi:hypothetical protein